jgi:endogenous inhibitor of DNA gyrase (YacG/DUF329 family)
MSKPVTFPCPYCKQPSHWHDNPARPFCSERCKLIDLGAWANEDYKIASQTAPEHMEPKADDDLND